MIKTENYKKIFRELIARILPMKGQRRGRQGQGLRGRQGTVIQGNLFYVGAGRTQAPPLVIAVHVFCASQWMNTSKLNMLRLK